MGNQQIRYNAANEEMINKVKQHEIQMTILMDLMEIPENERNFVELKNKIEKIIAEKNFLQAAQIQSNSNVDIMVEVSPLEKILNNPGLVHLAENIFSNLDNEKLDACGQINQSSKQILANPIFWLRKFTALSKENQKDWMNFLQQVKNTDIEKYIITYLKWNLKKEASADLPYYSNPAVQDDFKKKICKICAKGESSDEDIEIVKILAPLTDNPNAPNKDGNTPVSIAVHYGYTEILKILAPLTNNPNAHGSD